MALIDALYNSITALSGKATKGMDALLKKPYPSGLARPYRVGGIIDRTKLQVERHDPVITVYTDFPSYAYYVEHGRGPGGKPPVSPLIEWCKQHSIPEDAAWGIRNKIAKEGTKGKNFATPLRRMVEMVVKTCSQVGASVVEDEVYSGVKTLEDINVQL